jgi:geranylgeranyl diphosphate synthase type II
MEMDFKKYYEDRKKLVNTTLEKRMQLKGISKIDEAMKYSLLAGGKRLRPILLMASCDAVGGKGYDCLSVACGLEMIHTYSLIHDDLPCMDNDDYRRGRLTNHKVYGYAPALLAGDGLLTLAFEVMLEQTHCDPKVLVNVVREVALCAGKDGMVGGQVLDMEAEKRPISAEELKILHEGKTGALFIAAIRGGAQLGGATEKQLLALTTFARYLGLAFQITDDILDVTSTTEELGKPVGSDEKNHKTTYVTLYTLAGAEKKAEEAISQALDAIKDFGPEADPLREIAKMMCARKN